MEESVSPDTEEIRPMSLSDIIGNTFGIFGKGFFQMAAVVVLGSAFIWILSWLLTGNMIDMFSEYYTVDPLDIIGVVFVVVFSWILTAWMNGGLVYLSSSIHFRDDADIGMALKRATGRLPRMLGAYIVLFLITLVPALLFTFVFAGFSSFSPVVGLVALFIILPVYLYFIVRWSFIGQAVFIENKGPMDALSRSSELVKDFWWHTFGYLVVFVIFGFVLSLALNFIPFAGPYISTLVVTPIGMIANTLIYWDLRSRQEAVSLATVRSELAETAGSNPGY